MSWLLGVMLMCSNDVWTLSVKQTAPSEYLRISIYGSTQYQLIMNEDGTADVVFEAPYTCEDQFIYRVCNENNCELGVRK